MKTITIGTGTDYLKELESSNIYVSERAKDLLNKIPKEKEQELDLVVITPRDLGFTDWTSTKDLFSKAKEMGYELCPPETGPQLRLQTESKDYMIIAMEPVTDRHGVPNVFCLDSHDAELHLNAYNADPGSRWDSSYEFVFLSRKLDLSTHIIAEYVEKKDLYGLAEYFRAYIEDELAENEERKLCNSGRRMYQQGIKDERKRCVEIVEEIVSRLKELDCGDAANVIEMEFIN